MERAVGDTRLDLLQVRNVRIDHAFLCLRFGLRGGEAGFCHLSFGPADVVVRLGDHVTPAQRLGARELGLGEREAGLGLGYTRLCHGYRGLRTGHRRLGARLLRFEFGCVHDRKDVACGDEIALLHRDRGHPPGKTGRDIDEIGFNPAVAPREALGRQAARCQEDRPKGIAHESRKYSENKRD